MKGALQIGGIILAMAAVLAAMVLIPALLIGGAVGALRADTEIARIESPDGSRYAVIIESNHGATGGATYVEVAEQPVKLLFFSITGPSRRVYSGRWGEARSIQVS